MLPIGANFGLDAFRFDFESTPAQRADGVKPGPSGPGNRPPQIIQSPVGGDGGNAAAAPTGLMKILGGC